MNNAKIKPVHLARKAVLYIRQSSLMGSVAKDGVLATKSGQLRYPKTGLHGDQQECPVPTACPSGLIRRCQERVDLRTGEKLGWSAVRPFTGHCQDPLDQSAMPRFVQRRVPEKGVNRGEAGVATPRAIAAVLLEVIEEGAKSRRLMNDCGCRRAPTADFSPPGNPFTFRKCPARRALASKLPRIQQDPPQDISTVSY